MCERLFKFDYKRWKLKHRLKGAGKYSNYINEFYAKLKFLLFFFIVDFVRPACISDFNKPVIERIYR